MPKLNSVQMGDLKLSFANLRKRLILSPTKVLLVATTARGLLKGDYPAPPTGLYRLNSYLRANGVQTLVYDCNLEGNDKLLQLVSAENFGLIGFSLLYPNLANDLRFIEKIREKTLQSLLVAGGQGVVPQNKKALGLFPVDIFVLGAGEKPLLNIAGALGKEDGFEQLLATNGLFLHGDKDLFLTGFADRITREQLSLFSKTFDFAAVPYEKYWNEIKKIHGDKATRSIRVMTSSYCPKNCIYCSSTAFERNASGKSGKVVYLDSLEIIDLLIKALKAHPRAESVYINDDNFTQNPKRVLDFCDQKKNKLPANLQFFCMGDSRSIVEYPAMIKAMKEANFKVIALGTESFDDDILRYIGGKATAKEAIKAIEMLLAEGIEPMMNIILFPPPISKDGLIRTIKQSVAFIKKGANIRVHPVLDIYPGAKLFDLRDNLIIEQEYLIGFSESVKLDSFAYPSDPFMRQLYEKAYQKKTQFESELKETLNSKKGFVFSAKVDALILFHCIYELLHLPTNEIKEILGKELSVRWQTA